MTQKQIILLVGPKGSGKTHIGTVLQNRLGITFVRIEDIWLQLQEERDDFLSPAYVAEGFKRTLAHIESVLARENTICLETTAANDAIRDFITRLEGLAVVKKIRIRASPETCLQRVKTRDRSVHVDVSDDMVDAINAAAQTVEMDWAQELDNDPFMGEGDIVKAFHAFAPR